MIRGVNKMKFNTKLIHGESVKIKQLVQLQYPFIKHQPMHKKNLREHPNMNIQEQVILQERQLKT